MKIAIVLPHFYPYVGGGEKMFYDLAKGLIERGHEVKVVARNVGEEYMGQKTVDGIDVLYCPWKSMFGHPWPKKKDIEPVIKWCDVVHTSIFTTSPIVSKLARKYKKKSVLTIYEARGNKWYWADSFIKATIFYIVEQVSCRQKFDCYHAISDATKADVELMRKSITTEQIFDFIRAIFFNKNYLLIFSKYKPIHYNNNPYDNFSLCSLNNEDVWFTLHSFGISPIQAIPLSFISLAILSPPRTGS